MSYSRIRLKMCGMTRVEDIAHAISLGADAIGLLFYEGSSRYITIEKAKQLLCRVPAFVDTVAVFVNAEEQFVRQVITELPIACLQFHGDESPRFCEQFGRPYIKAIPATSSAAIGKAVERYQQASAILLDTPSATTRGGTGVPFDWTLIPFKIDKPIILSGGLNSKNLQAAVTLCSPYAVDVCSGIESAAGIKDIEKMNEFVNVLWGRG